jgi:hypothetical protein
MPNKKGLRQNLTAITPPTQVNSRAMRYWLSRTFAEYPRVKAFLAVHLLILQNLKRGAWVLSPLNPNNKSKITAPNCQNIRFS